MREAQAQEDRAACASACPHDILSPSSKIRKGARCHEQPAWPVDGGRFVGGALHRLPGGAVGGTREAGYRFLWAAALAALTVLGGRCLNLPDRRERRCFMALGALMAGAQALGLRLELSGYTGVTGLLLCVGAGVGAGPAAGCALAAAWRGAVRAAAGPEGTSKEHAPGRMGLRCTDLRMLAAGDAGLLAGNISL